MRSATGAVCFSVPDPGSGLAQSRETEYNAGAMLSETRGTLEDLKRRVDALRGSL